MVEWLAGSNHRLLFPSPLGKVYHRSSDDIQAIVERGRALIPDLTFRQCRTTFATLFEGDEADPSGIIGPHVNRVYPRALSQALQERRQRSIEELDKRLKVVGIDKKRSA